MIMRFDNYYVNSIKEGIKTSTILKNFLAEVGDTIRVTSDKGPFAFQGNFGFIKIREIKYIRFGDIDKEIAMTEGYLHEDLLKADLNMIYDDLEDSDLLYYILFEFKENEEDF